MADGCGEGAAIDLQHLSNQTFGDPELEREVLALFMEQALSVRAAIVAADADARRRLAHGLVGSARAIGAFALADCAAALEGSPDDDGLVARLSDLVEEVRTFAAPRLR